MVTQTNPNPIVQALVQLFAGTPAAAGATPQAPAPVVRPQVALPAQAPIPQARPATLPSGSFAPARVPTPPIIPDAAPVPPPRPMDAAAMQQPAMAPQQPDSPKNMLMQLLSGGGAGGDPRQMFRAFAMGAGNIGSTGGDPFVALGRGLGGAQGYYADKEAAAAASAAKADETAYQREMDAAKMQRDAEKDATAAELKKISEARLNKQADLTNQKTALEIRREARQNGITTQQMLEIESTAQAAGENLYGDERQKSVDATRERLLDWIGAGKGISGGAGLSAPEAGTVEGGYRFNGGDPVDQNNWTPVT